MYKSKKEKGITLIALVITIIIMLILAGVTINLSIGENGIFKIAQGAIKDYEKAGIEEELQCAIIDIKAEQVANGKGLTLEQIAEKINTKLETSTEIDKGQIIGEYKDYEYTIDNDLNLTVNDKLVGKITINYTVNTEEIGAKEVVITINATTKEGTITKIVKPDGNIIENTNEITYVVTKSGSYQFIVENSNGVTRRKVVKISNIVPSNPEIKVEGGYPIIKPTGIVSNTLITINFDKNDELENLYSEDNGQTWIEYKNPFRPKTDKIIAKSQFKNNPDVYTTSESLTSVGDAVPSVAFDGNEAYNEGTHIELRNDDGTFAYWKGEKRIDVEANSTPFNIKIVHTRHEFANTEFNFYNKEGSEISSIKLNVATWTVGSQMVQIPKDTEYIMIYMTHWEQIGFVASNCIYEIVPVQ